MMSPEKLDELKWRFIAATSGALSRCCRQIPDGSRLAIVLVTGPEFDIQVAAADCAESARMVLELSQGAEPELGPCCEFCARVARFVGKTNRMLVCKCCKGSDPGELFKPIGEP